MSVCQCVPLNLGDYEFSLSGQAFNDGKGCETVKGQYYKDFDVRNMVKIQQPCCALPS